MRLLRFVLGIETSRQLLLMGLVALSVGLSFVNITIEGRIVDDAIRVGTQTGSPDLLLRYALAYLCIIVVTNLLEYTVEVLYTQVTQRILIRLRTDLFSHVLRLGLGFYHKNSVGEIMSRIIPEVQQLGNFLARMVLVPLSCTLTIVCGFGLVLRMDWRLGLVALGIFSLVFLFLPRLNRRVETLSRAAPRLLRTISRRTEESLSHVGEIHAHNTYAFEERRFRDSLDELYGVNVDLARVFGRTSTLSGSLSQLATLSAYTLGGWLVIRGHLTVGGVFVVVRALSTVMSPINTLIGHFQRFREAEVRFEMLSDYLEMPAEMVDSPDTPSSHAAGGGFHLDNVGFGFDNAERILRKVDLDIAPGEHVAVVGPAGCGKSTLLLLLTRMVKASDGRVALDGVDVNERRLTDLRADVGYVAQAKTSAPVLFGGTLGENLLYGLQRRPDNAEGTPRGWIDLESLGLQQFDDLYAHVVETLREVGLYDDVLDFGLSKVTLHDALQQSGGLFAIDDPDAIRTELVRGRRVFRDKIAGHGELVELFDPEAYLQYGSILENLVFTSPDPILSDPRKLQEWMAFLGPLCAASGLLDDVLAVGRRVLIEGASILRTVCMPRTELAGRLGLSPTALRDDMIPLAEKLKDERLLSSLEDADKEQVLRLGLEYTLARAVDVYIDDAFKRRVIEVRAEVRRRLPDKLRDSVAFYDQELYVDGATARDNIIMGKVNAILHRADERVAILMREVIAEIDLEDELVRLGLMMDVGERGARLSGGQAQKTALARVLLKRPRVLVLDEATSALDNASQRKVHRLLDDRWGDRTVVHVAHRLDAIRDYDRIVVMEGGQVVESGDFQTLMAERGLFHRLWTSGSQEGR